MFARLYPIRHPRVNFAVSYTDPTKREATGRAKRVVKTFVLKSDAEKYQATINKNLPVAGVRGLALDDHARADFFAARQTLDLAGVNLSLADVARAWLAANPTRIEGRLLLDALLVEFIDHKAHVENCKPRTIRSLEDRLRAWFRDEGLLTVADLTRDACLALRSRKGPSATTRKNDMNAASSFLSWLHECGTIPVHPLRGLRRPTADEAKRIVWTVAEARAWFNAAAAYREGRFVPSLVSLFFGGLRPGEQGESRFVLDGEPVLRAEGGKLRGRANRTVPLCAAAVHWLAVYPPRHDGRFPPLTVKAREALKKAAGLPWAQDAARHTFISARAAIIQHEGQVAREAGTSIEIIHRHYHRTLSREVAESLMGLLPATKRNGRTIKT
jgi:hypothetical protein